MERTVLYEDVLKGDGCMKKESRLQVKIIFFAAAIALIVLSAFSYIRIRQLIEAAELVDLTQEVKLSLERAYSELEHAQSSQRGYILSKNTAFLNNYYHALENLQRHINTADSLTKDNHKQQENIQMLRKVINKRVTYMMGVLADSKHSTISPDRLMGGKALMEKVRQLLSIMESEEDKLLETHSSVFKTEVSTAPLLTITLSIGAVLILVFAYIKILQELRVSDTLRHNVEVRERNIQTILEAAPDVVETIDSDGIITSSNAEAENMFGWNKDETIGKTLTETIIPDRHDHGQPHGMKHYLLTGEGPALNKAIEVHGRTKADTEVPIELKISTSQENDSKQFIGFMCDITNCQRIEKIEEEKSEQLAKANEILIAANKELESFTYISSHDLQEPLRQIQNFISRIKDKDHESLSENSKKFFSKIESAAARMQALIAGLLAYSRAKNEAPTFEQTDIQGVVN